MLTLVARFRWQLALGYLPYFTTMLTRLKFRPKTKLKYFPYIPTSNSGAFRVILILKMSERPKRLATRPDYRQLSDVKLPRNVPRSSKRYKASSDTTDTKLYRLRVLERRKMRRMDV